MCSIKRNKISSKNQRLILNLRNLENFLVKTWCMPPTRLPRLLKTSQKFTKKFNKRFEEQESNTNTKSS